MHITYEDAKVFLTAAVEAKGADYVYVEDPKAIAKAKAKAAAYVAEHPTVSYYTGTVIEHGKEKVGTCTYRNLDGSPGCLIGQVFYDIDPDIILEDGGFDSRLIRDTDITMDERAVELFREAQYHQDSGRTWGEAVSMAVKAYDID